MRLLFPTLAAFAVLHFALPARAGDAETDAKLLVEQGLEHERHGQVDVALELYRAACLVAPKDATPHRLEASALVKLKRCGEALPELHAYLDLATADEKPKPAYADAVVELAKCLKEVEATIVLRPSEPARCAVDHGAALLATPDAPVSFAVAPGAHELSCEADGRPAASEVVVVTSKARKDVAIDLAPLPPPPLPPASPSPSSASPSSTAPSSTAPSSTAPSSTAPSSTAPASTAASSTAAESPARARVTPARASAIPEATAASSTAAESSAPARVTPARASAIPEATPVGTPRSEIRIQAHEGNWRCVIDGGSPVSFDASHVAVERVQPGVHVVDCARPNSQPLRARVAVKSGDSRVVRVKPYPLATATKKPAPPPESESAPPLPASPAKDPHADSVEWRLETGLGAGLGTLGFGVGARYGAFEGMVGTGLYPLALSATYYFRPGLTGAYLSVGYVHLAQGLLGAGSEVEGTGLWTSGGIDVRSGDHLAFRLGVGLGYNSTGLQDGPVVFDLSIAYLP